MKILFKYLLILSLSFFYSSYVAAEPLKVGYIYIGPPGDHGWTYEHDQGRKYSINKQSIVMIKIYYLPQQLLVYCETTKTYLTQ